MRTLSVVLALASLAACSSDLEGGPEDLPNSTCFVGDTSVATPDGPRPIASLQVGDVVLSYDHAVGELCHRRIEAVHVSRATTICRLRTAGRVVRGVTPSHPFYDARRDAYVPLRDLKPDCQLLLEDGARGGIDDLEIEESPTPAVKVYELTVEGPEHNYFADGVLVHNKSFLPDAICGDGVVDVGETCDDGNVDSGDGCSATCEDEGAGGGGGEGGSGGAGGGGAGGAGGAGGGADGGGGSR